jgi:hypothetical protein
MAAASLLLMEETPHETTDQLGCGLAHEERNNPRSAHTPLKLPYFYLNTFWCKIYTFKS